MPMQNVVVVVYLESQVLTGYMSLPENTRLSDFLNSSLSDSPDNTNRFLEMTDVTISYTDGKKEKEDKVYINPKSIKMVKTLDKDLTRGIGACDVKSYPFIEKVPMPVKMHIQSYELYGYLHCFKEQSLAALLTQRQTFFTMHRC